jgi:hypothetical protein
MFVVTVIVKGTLLVLVSRRLNKMREQVEILIYQYKKQHNLDVYTPLDYWQMWDLLLKLWVVVKRIEYKVGIKYGKEKVK